jgi:hypothetical protein
MKILGLNATRNLWGLHLFVSTNILSILYIDDITSLETNFILYDETYRQQVVLLPTSLSSSGTILHFMLWHDARKPEY